MKIVDQKVVRDESGKCFTFLRIEPGDISVTLQEIIDVLCDLSWISRFDSEYIKEGYSTRAKATVKYICEKIANSKDDPVSNDAAEYIVSELAREALVSELKYKDVPLGEIFKEKIAGNPGFDFFTQTLEEIIVFGEAKYLSKQNAYGVGINQVVRFIREQRDIADLIDLNNFFSATSLDGVIAGNKAFSIAFSAKQTSSDSLIRNIMRHKNYKELTKYRELIFVAVDI